MPYTAPSSLIVPTPAAGHALARLMAAQLPSSLPDAGTMEANLRTGAGRAVDLEVATAIYFHAIALANQGWTGERTGQPRGPRTASRSPFAPSERTASRSQFL
jgi:hypothetical protein